MFQKSVLKSVSQDESKVAIRWAEYQKYLAKIDWIKDAKEEIYQDGFLKDIFESCLGYTLNSTNPNDFNLEREKKNETDGKKADGVIYVNDEVIGVIELKAQDTKNLDKIEAQAFNYHNSHSNSRYIIISNFDELRFYIDKKTAYEKFSLFTLNYEDFKKLHLLLSYESIKDNLPQKLKEKTATFEQEISKNLYKDFSLFRNHIYENLVKNNDLEKSLLLRLTQKLCDRIIFILFAEDRGLLAPNTIKEIRQRHESDGFGDRTMYDYYKLYFNAINKGNERLNIPKYNGGLFAEDEILDSLIIDDFILDLEAQALSNYDFMSDVGVNILGHIFEQSLTDLEEINASINNTDFDKTKSKRKKDGVFYTPEYITHYIVENTLGKLCSEKREALHVEEITVPKNSKKPTKTEQITKDNLEAYREWLLHVKILDPACGSGAFLNQALDFLISEHKALQKDLVVMGDITAYYDIEKSILENNLYGVDINEEAVEIAKLSLWLRTASKGRELTKLADKIVCANSLLDMPFEEGSFDVVIGNPPYVRQEMIDNDIKDKYISKFQNVATSTADLYVYFYELSIKLLAPKGLLGFITPNKWMERKYGVNLRNYLKKYDILEIINYGELSIFDDASTEPAIIILKNEISNKDISYLMVKSLEEAQALEYKTIKYQKNILSNDIWKFTNSIISSILNKFKDTKINLSDYTDGGVYYGIKTGLNQAFIIENGTYNKIINEDSNSKQILKKMVEGDNFGRWYLNHSGRYMVATEYDLDIREKYSGIYNHLEQYKEKLIKRQDKGANYWNLRACDYYDKLEKPKLIYYHTALTHGFYFDTEGYYISANCYFIANADKYLQCVLNSKLFHFIKKYLFPAFGDAEKGGRVRLDANKMNKLPIKDISEEDKLKYVGKANVISDLSREFQDIKQNFINELELEKLTKKLQNFEEMEFEEFVSEYTKAKKIKFAGKLKERNFKNEWKAIFENDKTLACRFKTEIQITDKEINKMVYELYGLSDEEILIVEGI
jgi:type I restriction-modification system DNA methylase subunit